MKFFFATGSGAKPVEDVCHHGGRRVLLSYWDLRKSVKSLAAARASDCEVFIDSGAYSAFTHKAEISLSDYISFLHAAKPSVYATLDKIGDAIVTWENTKLMEAEGLKPLPAYHASSDIGALDKILENYDRFAIGGLVPYTKARKMKLLVQVLDKIWARVIAVRGTKNLPAIHAFGMSSATVLQRFPFASADSTGWFSIRQYGLSMNKRICDRQARFIRRKNDTEMFRYEVEHYLTLERTCTKLWESRGITWKP